MATLVLGAVGGLIGGPIGAAVGTLLGQAVDRQVLAPKGRQGPRLGDLSIQTSRYGTAIPRLFGRMRVAGTVIWATDLREDRHSSGSAKAGGKTTTYSYSASFAVALSARPIVGVGRIWADGKLLRGAAGDWKGETGFRLYLGGEDQPVDPLIAAAEGIDATPAHRGLAYAVFEGMQLADYGNRIPSLTLEVTADDGDVPVARIAAELSGGALTGDGGGNGGVALGGFAAAGDSVRGALEALVTACPMPLSDDGAVLHIGAADLTTIPAALLGSEAGDARTPARERMRDAAGTLPDAVALGYYEPARDYQAGLQRARRDGIGRREQRIDLPAALSADAARMLAEDRLARAWAERERVTAQLPWRMLGARCGTLATIDGDGPWRIAGWTLERMALQLRLVRHGPATALLTGADAGRATRGTDAPAGATTLALVDLPGLDDGLPDRPRLMLAAAGTGAGWRRAIASLSLDGGASWQAAGQTALPATIGSAATVLSDGSPLLTDRRSSVDVDLLHDGMALAAADMAALVNGANLALLGDELVQFGTARQLSARRWRLGTLLRGRRGTEWATMTHVAGERFLLIEAATLLPLDVPVTSLGTEIAVSALGPGDGDVAVVATATVAGRALQPPAPVGLRVARDPDGTVTLAWTRRSRLGWPWLDGTDAPLAEDRERYRVTLTATGGVPRTFEPTEPRFLYSLAMQGDDGAIGAPGLTATVVQLGTQAASLPAHAAWIW